MKEPKIQYIVLDKDGSDACDYLHSSFEEAEKEAEEIVNEHGGVLFVCKITPIMKISRNGVTKETL